MDLDIQHLKHNQIHLSLSDIFFIFNIAIILMVIEFDAGQL